VSVCLVMIVKNEAPVIERCLASVLPEVNAAVIVDTGSTDATLAILEAEGVEVHRRPWVDFGHNRTEALDLARRCGCDWLLVMDADHVLHGSIDTEGLAADAYYLEHRYAGASYGLACLLRADFPWRYEGVVHEYLTADVPHAILDYPRGVWVDVYHDGARARRGDAATYAEDAALLRAALQRNPADARSAFYFAQSLKDAGQLVAAREAYQARMMLAGWDEETWYARLEYARLTERTSCAPEAIERAYLAAWSARPTRAEPLVDLARWHRLNGEFSLAFLFARAACNIPQPKDRLFVDLATYAWRALDEAAIAGWYAGEREFGAWAAETLLYNLAVPMEERPRIAANAKFYA
jgi:glycosyltransferase involved in cell wall biosynthesis